MHFKKHFIVFILSLFWISIISAQNRTEVCVDFQVGETTIDLEFSNNADRLSDIVAFLQTSLADSNLKITTLEFSGMSSPEGETDHNHLLSNQRMMMLERYICSRIDIPDSIVTHRDRPESLDYLDSLVVNSDMLYRNEVSDIIRNTPIFIYKDDKIVDGRKKKLMNLNYGRTWKEMDKRFFRAMRNACVLVITCGKVIPKQQELKEELPPIEEVAPTVEEKEDSLYLYDDSFPEVEDWTRHLYLKTNTIGLGMLVANAAVEVDLSRHWSFNLPVYFSAWNYTTSTLKFRTLAMQPEIRYWFTENDGWFIGAHFGMAYYNIAWDGDYRIQDHNRSTPALGGGLGLGYRLPLSKRWQLELALGGGVYDLHYDKFHNERNGLLIESVKKTYFGIDQVAVSFSYIFDLKKKKR